MREHRRDRARASGRVLLVCMVSVCGALLGAATASPAAARAKSCHPTVLLSTPSGVATIDPATGTKDPTNIGTSNVGDIVIAPNGKTAFVSLPLQGAVGAIDLKTRTMRPTTVAVGGFLTGIAITPDGKTLVVGNINGQVWRIDAKTMTKEPTDTQVTPGLHQITITPDSKTAFVTNYGGDDVTGIKVPVGTVSTIDVKTGKKHPTDITVGGTPFGVAITPNGRTAWVVNGNQPTDLQTTVSTVDVRTRKKSPTDLQGMGVGDGSVAFTPNGRTAVVTSVDGVSVVDVKHRTVRTHIPVKGVPLGVAITPDGSTAYVVTEFGGTVATVHVHTATVDPAQITIGGRLAHLAVTPCR
jgi:DNA-binding beta-propeller fold protein YncE